MDNKKKDDEIIEVTEEEPDEIFADEDFEIENDFAGIRNRFNEFYARDTGRKIRAVNKAKVLNPTAYKQREGRKTQHQAPDKSGGKRKQKIHICYDLVGFIPVDELPKAEQA